MTTPTQPLREEHKELFPHIESLRNAGEAINGELTPSTISEIDEAYDFLTHHLIPHAMAEDEALYPMVQQVMGAKQATATMSRDHTEVGRLVQELASLRSQLGQSSITNGQVKSLQRVLFGLYTLVKLHFAKEEEIYLPLLDAKLTDEEAHAMFEKMEAAAQKAKLQLAQ